MFFSIARLRLALVSTILLASFSRARQDVLFTSSVSYCALPQEILVDELEVTYYRANNSVSFNVSAAAVLADVNVTANLYLNVYGMHSLNYTIDLCALFDGILCPLPEYNFVGADSIALPPSVDLSSTLPGIAFVIPDLEAYAQLTLIEVGTGDVKACLQTTIANGWSARQYAVEWSIAAIALFGLAAAIYKSVAAGALALSSIRLLDLIYLFQTIAASGLLGLDYPTVYTSFALNFSWILGLYAQSSTSHLQNSINTMRNITGGDSSTASSTGSTAYVNRKLSPYNSGLSVSLQSSSFIRRSVAHATSHAKSLLTLSRRSNDDVAVVTEGSSDVLDAGIPIYVNDLGIATADAFMTIFLISLIYAAVVLVSLGLGFLLYLAVRRTHRGRRYLDESSGLQAGYLPFAKAWGIRASVLAAFPILIFVFYQWTLHDSWLSVLLSVIALLIIMALILPPTFLVLMPYLPAALTRRFSRFSAPSPSLVPLTAPFRDERVWYLGPLLLAMVVKALVTAFGHAHGLVQAIILLITEIALLVSLVVFKPYRTRHADILQGYLAIVRVVSTGLMIAFAESIGLMAIPRVVIGVIIMVIFAVTVVVMFLNILVNLGLWRLVLLGMTCGKRGRRGDRSLRSNPSDLNAAEYKAVQDAEKGRDSSPSLPGSSDFDLVRPRNPSPPATATHTPTSASSEIPSLFSESTETTLGNTLPRRWSFQHSRPPSASEVSPSTGSFASRPSVTSSPATPVSSGLPSQRHSRHPSSSAHATAPIAEGCEEGEGP